MIKLVESGDTVVDRGKIREVLAVGFTAKGKMTLTLQGDRGRQIERQAEDVELTRATRARIRALPPEARAFGADERDWMAVEAGLEGDGQDPIVVAGTTHNWFGVSRH